MMNTDVRYMRRALQIAANGRGGASPNPMVGAVIVASDGRIIGEGWHRVRGLGHAEVNAVASVATEDKPLLGDSTMYVTLEPCSHYGKTPPCAELIIRTGIPRVVVATVDPNPKVAGRGIRMLREAGVEVETGILGQEARNLNRRFFTSQLSGRPWITLKWACSADGYMDRERTASHPSAYRFSNPVTGMMTMRLRSLHDAVMTTTATVEMDDCRLTVRGWYGRQPLRLVLDLRHRADMNRNVFQEVAIEPGSVAAGAQEADIRGTGIGIQLVDGDCDDIGKHFKGLYNTLGVSSLLVEAGPRLLRRLIDDGLWDAAREEVAASVILGTEGRGDAPQLPGYLIARSERVGDNRLNYYLRCKDVDLPMV